MPSDSPLPLTAASTPTDRSELIGWAEPVIADRVSDIYREVTSGHAEALPLIIQHRRLWRSMILDHRTTVQASRKALQALGTSAGLADNFVDVIDREILAELMDIVLTRYHSSRLSARRFAMVLMTVASNGSALKAAA